MARKCGISPQLLFKYIYCGSVPGPEKMRKIEAGTEGLVTIKDFYAHKLITVCPNCKLINTMMQQNIFEKYMLAIHGSISEGLSQIIPIIQKTLTQSITDLLSNNKNEK